MHMYSCSGISSVCSGILVLGLESDGVDEHCGDCDLHDQIRLNAPGLRNYPSSVSWNLVRTRLQPRLTGFSVALAP